MLESSMIDNQQISDIIDPSKKLHFRHSFTAKWLISSLKENDKIYQTLHGSKRVKDVTAYDVSNGKGFLSIVLRCTVTFMDSEDSYSTVVKIPGFDSFVEAQPQSNYDEIVTEALKEQFVRMHVFECKFYNELSHLLRAPIPKIFKTEDWILGEKEGCIHMEDLTKRGKTLGYFDNVNLAQIKCFVRHLARMHKDILSVDPRIWRGKFLKGQMALVNFIDQFHAASLTFLEKCNRKEELKPIFDKYSKFMINPDYYLYVQEQAYQDLGLLPVIVHGDIYGGNLMFSINENGEIQNEIAAIIDWQQMREGSPMEDLARFLTNCCDGSVRREAETFIFEYYLECLESEFDGDKTKVPYTLEQLKTAYNHSFITQAFATIFMIQHMLTAVDTASPKIKEAYYDFGVLKSIHAFKDADQILQGEFKEFYQKYNC